MTKIGFVAMYEIKYNGLEYIIQIYRNRYVEELFDRYSFDVEYPGGSVGSGGYGESTEEHPDGDVIDHTVIEALTRAISYICGDDKISATKLLREIKLEEIFE